MSEYTTQLPRRIQLDGEWEVALAEIQYPRTWNNVRNRENGIYVIPSRGSIPQAKHIPVGYYSDMNTLIKNINGAIAEAGQEAKNNIKFTYDSLSGRVHIEIKNGAQVTFLNDLAAILGFQPIPFQINIDKTTTSPRVADVNASLCNLYTYVDLISPQLVGDTEVALLRVLPVEGVHGDMVTKTFQNPQYLPVIKKQFSTVEINIKTDTGERVPFESGKLITTLHFRRASYLL